jgi:hypothetical protein
MFMFLVCAYGELIIRARVVVMLCRDVNSNNYLRMSSGLSRSKLICCGITHPLTVKMSEGLGYLAMKEKLCDVSTRFVIKINATMSITLRSRNV